MKKQAKIWPKNRFGDGHLRGTRLKKAKRAKNEKSILEEVIFIKYNKRVYF
jgi:hypothetical protein